MSPFLLIRLCNIVGTRKLKINAREVNDLISHTLIKRGQFVYDIAKRVCLNYCLQYVSYFILYIGNVTS